MIFSLLLFLLLFACVAFLFADGMWSNAILLINVMTAALLATNFWEPTARWIENQDLVDVSSYTYFIDFFVLWGLFAIFLVIFRSATEAASKIRVRFLNLVDRIGGMFFAIWIGWVVVCFATMALHTAPLPRDFHGMFEPEQRVFMGFAPDRQWLAFVQKMSLGTFSRMATREDIRREPAWQKDGTRTFDPRGEFMPKYATRRANLETQLDSKKSLRAPPH
jgi:hypothetical protein